MANGIDYTALAKQAGAVSSQPAPTSGPVDYTALAKQAGAVSSQPAPTPPPQTSTLDDVGNFIKGTAEGAVKSAGESIQSLPWVGKKIISPEAMTAERAYFRPGSPAEAYGQTAGDIAEPILEFVMGDEALKGLAIAEKVGIASKIAKIAQDSPYIGKILQHGVNVARMGTVGTTEALAKGASLPDAVKTGVATGVGGEAISAAAEAAPDVVQSIARRNPFRKVAASDPGVISKVLQGEGVVQAPAQDALRAAVKTGGADVGLNTAQPASFRTIAEEPISAINAAKKNVYSQVDSATGLNIKGLYDKLDAISDKLDVAPSGSPEEAKLELDRTNQMQTIDDAKQAARAKGVDVDKLLDAGDALHTKEMAWRELQKNVLKNVNIVEENTAMGSPEKIKIDPAIKALQKMQDNSKFGAPRLEQVFGKDGAKTLLNNLYAAKRVGQSAVTLQNFAKWAGIAAATAAVGAGAAEAVSQGGAAIGH